MNKANEFGNGGSFNYVLGGDVLNLQRQVGAAILDRLSGFIESEVLYDVGDERLDNLLKLFVWYNKVCDDRSISEKVGVAILGRLSDLIESDDLDIDDSSGDEGLDCLLKLFVWVNKDRGAVEQRTEREIFPQNRWSYNLFK